MVQTEWQRKCVDQVNECGHVTGRVFIFQLFVPRPGALCNKPMGMQNRRIRNVRITASSQWNNYHGPYLARLHGKKHSRYIGAWSAAANNRYQWLQVNFGRPAKIVRIATQGRQDVNQWVTQYYVSFSMDGMHFAEFKNRNTRKVFFCTSWMFSILSLSLSLSLSLMFFLLFFVLPFSSFYISFLLPFLSYVF